MFSLRSGSGLVALGAALAFAAGPAGAQPKSLTQPSTLPHAAPTPQPEGQAPAQATAPTIVVPVSPPEGLPALIPLGPPSGEVASKLPENVHNPVHGNPAAIQQGRQLFVAMNCAGCHGYDAKGAMGPNLTDGSWTYGGTPAAIFSSIYSGRPEGMPAWGASLPAQEIWDIVAYIQSLGGTVPPDKFYRAMAGDQPDELTAPELEKTQNPSIQPAKPGGTAKKPPKS